MNYLLVFVIAFGATFLLCWLVHRHENRRS